jgi:hypothetical protein
LFFKIPNHPAKNNANAQQITLTDRVFCFGSFNAATTKRGPPILKKGAICLMDGRASSRPTILLAPKQKTLDSHEGWITTKPAKGAKYGRKRNK